MAVIFEGDAEKLRYLHAHSVAINSRGERVQLFLDDTYQLAEQQFPGKEVTRAEY